MTTRRIHSSPQHPHGRLTTRPARGQGLRRAWIVVGALVTTGCGSEVIDVGPGGVDGQACQAIAGAYQLGGEDDQFFGFAPWVLIHTSQQGCQAVVASTDNVAQTYDVDLTANSAVLRPVGLAARGGWVGLTEHGVTRWNELRLRHDGQVLTGTATADVENDWNQEDIGSVDEATVTLTVQPAGPAEVAWPVITLPWRPFSVYVSHPVWELGSHVTLPSADWSAADHTEVDSPGVIDAEVAYQGSWDAIRGQTLAFATGSSLRDLADEPVTASTGEVAIYDVGPAIVAHEMADTSTVASWGSVVPLTEGDCATLGCVVIHGQCGSYAGVAGQVDTTGKTQLVLSMRLVANEDWVDKPAFHRIEVVTEDGQALEPTQGGQWTDQIEQAWVYDVASYDKVGFAIEDAAYCHGWGGPIILESVRAQ